MKQTFKGIIVGMLIASLVFSSMVMFAAPVKQKIEVLFNNISVIVDGVAKPAPANTKMFIYNGSVYAPVNYVASLSNKKTSYDAKSGKLFISDTGKVVKELRTISLYDKAPIDQEGYGVDINRDMKGLHMKANFSKSSTTKVTYALNGLAKEFNADLNVFYNNYGNMKLIAYDENDRKIYESALNKAGMSDAHVKIDTTGLMQIKLEAVHLQSPYDYDAFLFVKNMSILTTDY